MAPSATINRLIRVAPGTVWEVWRDLSNWPRWQPGTTQAYWLDGEPWAPQSTFVLQREGSWLEPRRSLGRVLSTAGEQLLVWEIRPLKDGPLAAMMIESVRLEPTPGGTDVILTLTAHGVTASLLSPLWGHRLRDRAERTLEGLRRELAPAERRL